MSDAPQSRKILIVDDNLQNLELLEAYIEDTPGWASVRATSGEEALRKAHAERPDLILLDIMMPRMSGFEVCRKLKADPPTSGIPVIMVTALKEVSDVERGMESGADDFLSKPVNRHELIARIRTRLEPSQDGPAPGPPRVSER